MRVCSAHVHGAGDVRGNAGGGTHAGVRAADAGRVRRRRTRSHFTAYGTARGAHAARRALDARRARGLPRRARPLRQGLLQDRAAGEIKFTNCSVRWASLGVFLKNYSLNYPVYFKFTTLYPTPID
jgi:hypothetical protein